MPREAGIAASAHELMLVALALKPDSAGWLEVGDGVVGHGEPPPGLATGTGVAADFPKIPLPGPDPGVTGGVRELTTGASRGLCGAEAELIC